MNSLIGSAAEACVEHVFVNLARPTDGLNRRTTASSTAQDQRRGRSDPPAPGQGYTGRPRACGGIGRRARLRALWTEWSVEVRVLSGALGKPRKRGFFHAPAQPDAGVRLCGYCCHVATTHIFTHILATKCGYAGNALWVRALSVRYHRGGWETRWRDCIRSEPLQALQIRGRGSRLRRGGARGLPRRSPRGYCAAAGRASTPTPRARGSAGGSSCAAATAAKPPSAGSRASGRRPKPGADSSSRSNVARSSTPPRRSAATGSDGWPAAAPTSRRAPGAATRSAAASGCCPLSPTSALGHSRSTTSARSSPSRPRPWRPANSQPRRSTTRWSRSSSASTTPSRTG